MIEKKIKCPKHDTGGGPCYCDNASTSGSNELLCEDRLAIANEAAEEVIRTLKFMLDEVGGCDADDDYHKGYDKAVDEMELWMIENIPNFKECGT